MILSGCANSDRAGETPLAVAVPAGCETILRTVPEPVMTAGDDARLDLAKSLAALQLANKRIVKGRACEVAVREQFANSKSER